MRILDLKKAFEQEFDVVGIIRSKRYVETAEAMAKKVPNNLYPTLVVVGLSYAPRIISSSSTHLIPSFYTFGNDYHSVLKRKIEKVLQNIPIKATYGVDNHPHHERLAASLAGLGYFAKNQLIIHPTYGSYLFLGLVFLDIELNEEFRLDISDSCGSCRQCIDACPVHALTTDGFSMEKCMSYYNQSKKVLTEEEIQSNYSLFGCDICQMVCPKNKKITPISHSEFELSGKEAVAIVDLFTDSEKDFIKKYEGMAYLWKGKTILMRNALTLLVRKHQTNYNDIIEDSLNKPFPEWYKITAQNILKKLKEDK